MDVIRYPYECCLCIFLALPSLLHPSILLNCFLYLYKKITVAIMNTCHVNGIQCIIEGILRFEDLSKNCVKQNMNMYIIHKLYTAFQKRVILVYA